MGRGRRGVRRNPHLRTALEHRRTGYVLAISSTHPVITHAGKFQAKTLGARIPKRAWQRLSAGAGAKGERYYDWAQIEVHGSAGRFGQWCLLVRRNRRTGELAFYRCFSPRPVPMSELVRVAGRRWTVEETFQAGKGLTGLDEHQVRRWTSWHRWVTLAMLAHAFLAVTAAVERRDRPIPDGLIPMTGNEIQHLFAALIRPIHGLAHLLRWSLATPGSSPCTPVSLSQAGRRPAVKIKIYGWSTKGCCRGQASATPFSRPAGQLKGGVHMCGASSVGPATAGTARPRLNADLTRR
ncbi:hypothetical protein GCM10017674_60960 [Streptomyces gardneri]|uniref:Transposase IS4-like domain-containing protein n=1 Tax=Streptomyces gardneri TaxID=66892 RepID=A0A4Y3RHS0_9ACTN|nr:hypothetical protein SGA01_28270 [Streptomyces gardneri]GHH13534.1 hypothetical protein GCM10017674_60960 [Streptomyces gardneri]